ncbi:MAG: hypothetical protein E7620_05390 [Ruminococcaceae bacterium]|nr:hypothetical protein [Oscillospiraceae bacterium]
MSFWNRFIKTKRAVRVLKGTPFLAAYSEHPFEERRVDAPDYTFHEHEGTYWCVRVGNIEIPWGFGTDSGIAANGTVTVSRMNLNYASFTGKGLPYVCENEVFYLYEAVQDSDGRLHGFVPMMRDRLNAILREIANGKDVEELRASLKVLADREDVRALLQEHRLQLKDVHIDYLKQNQ